MKDFKETSMKYVFFMSALASVIAVIIICFFLFYNGIPAIREIGLKNFLFGTNWAPSDIPAEFGIFPMILGSILVTIGAIIIGVPLGVFTAMFMAHICKDPYKSFLEHAINLLAGIPSVIFGFFGMVVLVPIIRTLFDSYGSSILTASILLGIMILPTIISISQSSIEAVPKEYYEGALALGASPIRALYFVVLPAAKHGVLSAIVLGIGRAIGETMAVVMVAGNQARMPKGILKGIRTLTSNIVLEMGYAQDLHRGALIATGVVLFVFILIINLIFSWIKKRDDVK